VEAYNKTEDNGPQWRRTIKQKMSERPKKDKDTKNEYCKINNEWKECLIKEI